MTIGKDNDTPVQSQPRRDAGSRNEGGPERPSEGRRPVRQKADCRLNDFPRSGGVEDKCRSEIKEARRVRDGYHPSQHAYDKNDQDMKGIRRDRDGLHTRLLL